MDIKILLFNILCLIHIFVWLFIGFAFLNKKYASFNLYYLIPCIYIIHIFPFHIFNVVKESMYHDEWKNKYDLFVGSLFPINHIIVLQSILEERCFANPLGSQGMLILGAITSAYALKK